MNTLNKIWQDLWLPKKKAPNQNLQDRITGLFETKKAVKEFSPTLSVLYKQRNKVRRLKSVYEDNLKDYNNDISLSTPRIKSHNDLRHVGNQKSLEQKLESQIQFISKSDEAKKVFEKATGLLIKTDQEFIKNMQHLIEFYVRNIERLPLFKLKNDPKVTASQIRELFGPIEEIYNFHSEEFHPMLLASADDIELLSRNLSKMYNENRFKCYLVYAKDKKECENRRKTYSDFMNNIASKYGLPFNFDPIKHMEEIHRIIKSLLKNLENIRKDNTALRKAEDDLWKIVESIQMKKHHNEAEKTAGLQVKRVFVNPHPRVHLDRYC